MRVSLWNGNEEIVFDGEERGWQTSVSLFQVPSPIGSLR